MKADSRQHTADRRREAGGGRGRDGRMFPVVGLLSAGRGFTLVELLVTISLLVFVAGAVAATFSGGMRLWQRVQARGAGSEAAQIAFEQLRRDLRSARHFTPIGFEGEFDRVSFPGIALDERSDLEELGRVGYFFDEAHHRLCRSHEPYRLVRRFGLRDHCTTVMGELDRVRFSYYTFDAASRSGEWTGSWSSPEPPLAVKVEIRYHDPTGRVSQRESLVVHLPLAFVSAKQEPEAFLESL